MPNPSPRESPTERLARFLREQAPVCEEKAPDDGELRVVRELIRTCDDKLHGLIDALVSQNKRFYLYDIGLYPDLLLRGRCGERWNESGRILLRVTSQSRRTAVETSGCGMRIRARCGT